MNRGVNLTHEQARELVQKSLEARLDSLESASVAAHLAGCVHCTAYAEEIRAMDRRLTHTLSERWPERNYTAVELENRLADIQSRLRRNRMFQDASSFARLAGAAAALILLIFGLAWLVRGTTRQPLSSIAGGLNSTATRAPVQQEVIGNPTIQGGISIEQAGGLVRDWIFANNPGMNPDAQFPLQEITTQELWQRMKMQAYKVTDGVMIYEAFLIRDGQVHKLGESFGGKGIGSLEVTELDGDGSPELVYTYSFGSGIHQSSLGMVYDQNGEVNSVGSELYFRGDLSLEKVDDRTLILKQIKDFQVPEGVLIGMVRLLNGNLVIAPDLADMATYTSERFGLSFSYPADWQPAGGQADTEGYSGSEGFFALFPIQQRGMDIQDLMRACEWLANGSPAQYGDLPQMKLVSLGHDRAGCLVRSTSDSPDAPSALLFRVEGGQLALLRMDTLHAQVIARSLRFSSPLPEQTPEPVELDPQISAGNGDLETREVGGLTLREYTVVSASEDTPGHFEFNERIPPDILQRRKGWGDYAVGEGLAQANSHLDPFGYRLALKQDSQGYARFDLFKGSELIKGDLSMFFPVSAYQDEQGSGDFAMLVEDNQGRWLVRSNGIEKWDDPLHRFTRPVMVGARLVTVERRFDLDGSTERFVVMQDGQPVFTYTLAPSPVEEQVKTLAEWNDGWALEVNGTLLVNGEIYNQKGFPADEIFNWTMLNERPFFFFERDGKVGAWYDGQELAVQYDEVIHDRCCEPAAFNVVSTPETVWFYARKDGVWYFVELGKQQ